MKEGMEKPDSLYDRLISYTEADYYPMHMPGHKRNPELMAPINPYGIDITEIEGFDNLHQPEGILKSLSERMSRLYGAKKSFPLINGSTAGILAGISAATDRGDKILIARNSHKSVYHAAIVKGLKPVYLYPQSVPQIPMNGGILPSEINEMLINNKGIRLVVITSPTYEGVVSDVKEIADIVHRHGALLLVDEAHGAHFGFHKAFPESAVRLGADLIIQSLHKTLPALTQSAVLHSNVEQLNRKLQHSLSIYQSSSPSYLLMAGMDWCIRMLEDRGTELFEAYHQKLDWFYQAMGKLSMIKIAESGLAGQKGIFCMDPSKLTISVKSSGISGHQLQKLLRDRYHIEMEMAAPEYVLGMTSIGDTEAGFHRLAEALLQLDRELAAPENPGSTYRNPAEHLQEKQQEIRPLQLLSPQEATERETETVNLTDSDGRISAVFISLFPPGSPLLVPGERIDRCLIEQIEWVKQQGITITGLEGNDKNEIEVVSRRPAEIL